MYSIKNILIVLLSIVLLSILGFGGYYYYFEIYQPKQYAKEIVPLYEKLALSGFKPDTSELEDEKDYQKALTILAKKKQEFSQANQNLSTIHPSKKFQSFHQDFSTFLELNLAAFEDAESRAKFLIKANELNEAFKKISQPEIDLNQPIKTVADFQKFFKDRISKIQLIGQETFKENLPLFDEPSFLKLKSSWVEANEGLSFILDLVESLNPKLPPEESFKVFPLSQTKRAEEVMKKTEEFSQLLEEVISQNTVTDILAFRHFNKVPQIQMSENFTRIYKTIQELKTYYKL